MSHGSRPIRACRVHSLGTRPFSGPFRSGRRYALARYPRCAAGVPEGMCFTSCPGSAVGPPARSTPTHRPTDTALGGRGLPGRRREVPTPSAGRATPCSPASRPPHAYSVVRRPTARCTVDRGTSAGRVPCFAVLPLGRLRGAFPVRALTMLVSRRLPPRVPEPLGLDEPGLSCSDYVTGGLRTSPVSSGGGPLRGRVLHRSHRRAVRVAPLGCGRVPPRGPGVGWLCGVAASRGRLVLPSPERGPRGTSPRTEAGPVRPRRHYRTGRPDREIAPACRAIGRRRRNIRGAD